ncbi:MAG: hypothetical protein Q8O19_00205 [Rectinemataceae bacterium]|nr:hypothetical protein [Rectinemataceae bacterium]
MRKKRRLLDEYRFSGFRPRAEIKGVFGDSKARIIRLERRQKKLYAAPVSGSDEVFTIVGHGEFGICPAEKSESFWRSNHGEFSARDAKL